MPAAIQNMAGWHNRLSKWKKVFLWIGVVFVGLIVIGAVFGEEAESDVAPAQEVTTPLTQTPEPASSPTTAPTATSTPTPTEEPASTPTPTEGPPPPTLTPTPTLTPQATATAPAVSGAGTWSGLEVAPENRCAPYDADDYPYSQSVEQLIVGDMGGIIYGPYTGTWFASTSETDIEHIVARSEAHDSGLCAADAATRRRFASDILNLTLASPSVNRSQKSGKDAAEWLPDSESLLVRKPRGRGPPEVRPHRR